MKRSPLFKSTSAALMDTSADILLRAPVITFAPGPRGLFVCLFVLAFSTFNIYIPTSSLSLICDNPPLSCVISPVVIISSLNRTDASWKVWKSCFIDSKGMVIDPAEFAWEYILFEPRDHNRSDGITPVSAPLAFQRLR